MRAVRCSRDEARASIAHRTLSAGHEVFRAHLVPLQPRPAAAHAGVRDAAALPPRSVSRGRFSGSGQPKQRLAHPDDGAFAHAVAQPQRRRARTR